MNRPGTLREAALECSMEEPERALALAREALQLETGAESLYVVGVVLADQGETEEAMRFWREALQEDPQHVDAWAAIGRELLEQGDFEEAPLALLTALRLDPLHPEALYYRACLRERRGDHPGAARDYAAAAQMAPEDCPIPPRLDLAQIQEVVQQVLHELPPELRHYFLQVPILVEDVPSPETLIRMEAPVRTTTLLCSVEGPDLSEQLLGEAWMMLPPTLHLYRCNLQRMAADPEALRRELKRTLMEEVGQFLWLEEEDLEETGLA